MTSPRTPALVAWAVCLTAFACAGSATAPPKPPPLAPAPDAGAPRAETSSVPADAALPPPTAPPDAGVTTAASPRPDPPPPPPPGGCTVVADCRMACCEKQSAWVEGECAKNPAAPCPTLDCNGPNVLANCACTNGVCSSR